MSRRVSIFGSSFVTSPLWEPETIAYMTAVGIPADGSITVHGITGLALWASVDAFVVTAKAGGYWAKMVALYLHIGGTSVTNKWNAINPLDTDAAFRQTYFGGVTFNANGITGNRVNGYARTHVIPSISLTLNTAGVTMYQRNAVVLNQAGVSDKWFVGATNNASNDIIGFDGSGTGTFFHPVNDGFPPGSNVTDFQGIFTGNRTASNANSLFKNGIKLVQRTTASSVRSTITIDALRLNITAIPAGYGYVNANIATLAFHNGLSDAEVVSLHSAITTFNTALGR